MNVNDYLVKTRSVRSVGHISMLNVRPRFECKDGFSVSIQASEFAYSTPRSNIGPYSHVELGYPSEKVDEWMEYAEDEDDPTETVYPYIPVELVEQVLEQHGGLVTQST